MYYMQFGLALAMMGALWEYRIPLTEPRVWRASSTLSIDSSPPVIPSAWLRGDPADSLYRAAREALSRRDYRSAAALFGRIPQQYPRSGYAGDALYWQAFSLYRLGGDGDLREGLAALTKQRKRFPQAATHGDAATLERRIQGELARRGDPDAAAQVTREAMAVPIPP
ncbi:MAG TPA: hypothetical protein VIM84_01170, partial [Gemmatimonadales bacterium]